MHIYELCSSPSIYSNILSHTCPYFWLSTHHKLVNNLRRSIRPPTHNHTHTHSHTHTFSVSLTHTLTHTHTHSLSLSHTHTHTHTHTHRLRSFIHRYIHSGSRTDVVSTNSVLLFPRERLINVGQNRK